MHLGAHSGVWVVREWPPDVFRKRLALCAGTLQAVLQAWTGFLRSHMKLSFYGAAGEVTGSCYLLEAASSRVLIDFGLHQGDTSAEERNRRMPPFDASRLDAVVITHAHIDHIGRLPLLPRAGFKGPIFATKATCDLIALMLRDSARLQVADAERDARRAVRSGIPAEPPLYEEGDVERVLPMLKAVEYNVEIEVASGVRVRWTDAGHIIGSASLRVTARDGGSEKTLILSGDLGPRGVPLLRDPVHPGPADLAIVESTYGDREHRPLAETVEEFASIIREAVWSHQKVLIPAFAVGRTTQLLYYLGILARSGRVPRFPVIVDSPMASSAIEICRKHMAEFDSEATAMVARGEDPISIPDLRITESAAESRELNAMDGAGVIISASGMCTGGRIIHHLRHNLWRRGVHVVIVGYQSRGSLGRRLVEGADAVRIMGERIIVRANIHTLGGFSAHAGQGELLDWAAAVPGSAYAKPLIGLTHGEDPARAAMAQKLASRIGIVAQLPRWGASIEL